MCQRTVFQGRNKVFYFVYLFIERCLVTSQLERWKEHSARDRSLSPLVQKTLCQDRIASNVTVLPLFPCFSPLSSGDIMAADQVLKAVRWE